MSECAHGCTRVHVCMRAHSHTMAAHAFRGVRAGSTDGAEPRGPLRECRCLLERMEVSGKLCKGNGGLLLSSWQNTQV